MLEEGALGNVEEAWIVQKKQMFDHAVDTVGTAMAGVLVTQEVALAQHVALMVDQPMIPRLRGSEIKQMNAKKKQTQISEITRDPRTVKRGYFISDQNER